MKVAVTSLLLAVAALPQLSIAAPTANLNEVQSSGSTLPTEVEILNFALSLEHLETAFYKQGLQKYAESDFQAAGLSKWARGRFVQIAEHESSHVSFLQTALVGSQAVQPCNYTFPDTDPITFASTSFMLETVGVAAYSGAMNLLSNAGDIVSAASILAVEARQSAWINSAIFHANAWNTAFDTPLSINHVWTLASSAIVSCPSSNMALPATAYPALTFPSGSAPGSQVSVTFDPKSASTQQLYVAFMAGLNGTIVPLASGNMVTIPDTLQGVVFAIVTNSSTDVFDNVTIAGPAFLSFDFASGIQQSG